MSILTHDEAKRLSQSSTDPLEVIRNVEAAVIIKLAGSQVALKDEIRLIWQPKCDALHQQLEAAQKEGHATDQLAAAITARDQRIAELENECKAWALTVDNLEQDAAMFRHLNSYAKCTSLNIDGNHNWNFNHYKGWSVGATFREAVSKDMQRVAPDA